MKTFKPTEEQIREGWSKLFDNLAQYYPNARWFNTGDDPRQDALSFIVSPKKEWALDMLSRVYFNEDKDNNPCEPFRMNFKHGSSDVAYYNNRDDRKIYSIQTNGRYLNGNTLVYITVTEMRNYVI